MRLCIIHSVDEPLEIPAYFFDSLYHHYEEIEKYQSDRHGDIFKTAGKVATQATKSMYYALKTVGIRCCCFRNLVFSHKLAKIMPTTFGNASAVFGVIDDANELKNSIVKCYSLLQEVYTFLLGVNHSCSNIVHNGSQVDLSEAEVESFTQLRNGMACSICLLE
jgi:nucleoside recognition membrane protein YjiH